MNPIWTRCAIRVSCYIGSWFVLAGCISVDVSGDHEKLEALVEQSTGLVALRPIAHGAIEHDELERIWSAGLSEEDAIRIALANNPELLSGFASIGVARADLVRSGWLSNPSLSAAFLFPSGGGLMGIDVGLAQNIVELWRLPIARDLARGEVERRILHVADEARRLAGRVRVAFASAISAAARADLSESHSRLTEELVRLAGQRKSAGNGTELDVSSARAEYAASEVMRRAARREARSARSRLARLLGLAALSQTVELVSIDRDSDSPLRSVESLISRAQESRLDLRAAHVELERLEREVDRQRRSRYGLVGVGGSIVREPRRPGESTELNGGPTVDLELPIFHQNQGGIAAAEYALEGARRRLRGRLLDTEHGVRNAHESYRALRDAERTYRESVVPEFERQLELSQHAFGLGTIGYWNVIQALRALAAQRVASWQTTQRAAEALAELSAWSGLAQEELFDPSSSNRERKPDVRQQR